MRRKRKSKCKRCSHVERKRKQNEIRTCISVSQDGGKFPESALPLISSREARTLGTRLKMTEGDAILV